jgi:hypothetical protein
MSILSEAMYNCVFTRRFIHICRHLKKIFGFLDSNKVRFIKGKYTIFLISNTYELTNLNVDTCKNHLYSQGITKPGTASLWERDAKTSFVHFVHFEIIL